MASSTALQLVNKVLRMTGDAAELTTISGSVGGIGERIVDFINQTIGDVEKAVNWPFLRVNAQGTANGTDDIFEWSGTEDVRVGGAVSVWIPNVGKLIELTHSQFDEVTAENAVSGDPVYFQRGVSSSNKLQVQIFPLPASGTVINVSAFKKATRLSSADDTGTTEFDDDILVYGGLMHMDAYDGLDRGYARLYSSHLATYLMENYSNMELHRTVESYK